MLYIDPTSHSVSKALKAHHLAIRCRVTSKLGIINSCSKPNCRICNSRKLTFKSSKTLESKIIKYLSEDANLNKIISGVPEELLGAEHDFYSFVLTQTQLGNLSNFFKASKKQKASSYSGLSLFFEDLSKIFNYDWLSEREPDYQYSLYELAENLDRRSCTYCNRTYTTTLTTEKNKKLMRPQFDHWYPKSKHPLLALSFYNLIPSCYTCNSSSKGDAILDLKKHIHPYRDMDQTDDFSFSYIPSKKHEYHIYVRSQNTNKKALNTLKKIHIDRMYNAHLPELKDLIEIKEKYSENYINKLQKFFPKAGLPEKEIYRLVFGVEPDKQNFHKRPMSKFKYDILRELGIIKDK